MTRSSLARQIRSRSRRRLSGILLCMQARLGLLCVVGLCGSAGTLEIGCGRIGGGAANADGTVPVESGWARIPRSPISASYFAQAAVDASGNVYAVGEIWGSGTLDFGNGVTATAACGDSANFLLVKYDSSGAAQWAQTAADSNDYTSPSVAVDSAGNVYVASFLSSYGCASGAVDFGNGVTATNSDTFNNAVLVKYNASGAAQWVQAVTEGSSDSYYQSVVVDSSHNVYVAGFIEGTGTYQFGNNVAATGVAIGGGPGDLPTNAVLVKYDSSGTAQWAKTVSAGSPASSFDSAAVDSAGHVFVAGHIAGIGTYDFGNGVAATGAASNSPIAGEVGANLVLVKYDSSGNAEWAQTVSATDTSSFSSVATDSAGNVYAAGAIGAGTYDFGNSVTATPTLARGAFTGMEGPQFAVLAKYNTSGIAQWAKTVILGGPFSNINSVAVDSSGNVYAAGDIFGYSPGTYDFGNGAKVTASNDQTTYVVLVKYSPAGIPQWARSSVNKGSSDDSFNSVALDTAGHVYTAGGIDCISAGCADVVDFGNGVTATAGYVPNSRGNALLVKYP